MSVNCFERDRIMKKITITIDNFDNAAMADSPDQEVYEILSRLADRIGDGSIHAMPASVRDSNGNKVGTVEIEQVETPSGVCGVGRTDEIFNL